MLSLVTGLFFPSKDREWRKSVSFLLMIFGGVTMVNTWAMWGLFPVSLVFSGFASAGDIIDIKTQQTIVEKKLDDTKSELQHQMSSDKRELLAIQLRGQLNQLFDAMCSARRGSRIEEERAWEQQFSSTMIEYNAVSDKPYPMRNCT